MPPLADFAQVVGIAAAILTGLGIVWRKAIRPFARIVRGVVHVSDSIDEIRPHLESIPAALPVLLEMAETVGTELHPNGGSALKDQVQRVERDVGVIAIFAREAKGLAEANHEEIRSIRQLAEANHEEVRLTRGEVRDLNRYVAALHDRSDD